jgi:hypothetical protein
MKQTLIRFARDFTRLSEYFGPDDYDRNMNYREDINSARMTNNIEKQQNQNRADEERENKLSNIT